MDGNSRYPDYMHTECFSYLEITNDILISCVEKDDANFFYRRREEKKDNTGATCGNNACPLQLL